MNDAQQFWIDVAEEQRKITATVSKQKLQPATGDAVFMVSTKVRRNPEWREGVVCLVSMKLAATRVVEGTHEVATDVLIERFLKQQDQTRKAMESESTKKSLLFAARPASEALAESKP